jgi:hypothetical protein
MQTVEKRRAARDAANPMNGDGQPVARENAPGQPSTLNPEGAGERMGETGKSAEAEAPASDFGESSVGNATKQPSPDMHV